MILADSPRQASTCSLAIQYSLRVLALPRDTLVPFGYLGVPCGPTMTAAAAWFWVTMLGELSGLRRPTQQGLDKQSGLRGHMQ